MEYPKINSLWKREGCGPYNEEKHRYESDLLRKPRKSALIEGYWACEEFRSIKCWTLTEKVDGTNIRIIFDRSKNTVQFGGRTKNALIPTFLLTFLQETFTREKMEAQFPDSNYVILFGEGYGGKIQLPEGQRVNPYRDDVSFVLFDVYCSGWWLDRDAISSIAYELDVERVPTIKENIYYIWNVDEIVDFIKSKPKSIIAQRECIMEGVIALSDPMMLFRNGEPIKFKLKVKDYYE